MDFVLEKLRLAKTDTQKTWVITNHFLHCIREPYAELIRISAVPHWFNQYILAEITGLDASDSLTFYNFVKELSFCEPFGDLGHTLHDMTRTVLIAEMIVTNKPLLSEISEKAYNYFNQFKDSQNQVEASNHLIRINREKAIEHKLSLLQSYRKDNNHSAVHNIHRNLEEFCAINEKACELEDFIYEYNS